MSIKYEVKKVMNANLLLTTDTAKRLYNESVRDLPIIDWHNHLSVSDIFEDRQFPNICELWISKDPYKHRAMRICGVDEHYITGSASDYDKFIKWSETLPRLIGNPLYTWSHMELSKVFGTDEPLNAETAPKIWSKTEKMLSDGEITNNKILGMFNIEYSSPCRSAEDDVSAFKNYTDLAPSLRGDSLIYPTAEYIAKLSKSFGMEIGCMDGYIAAVKSALVRFSEVGCRIADHALDDGFTYFTDDGKNTLRFDAVLSGKELEIEDKMRLASHLLLTAAAEYSKLGWTMLLHIGAHRRTSDRLLEISGPAGGYAAIGTSFDVSGIITLLNDIEKTDGGLPKVILIPLNASDSPALAAISGSFSKSGVNSVISQGPAWWWCDHAHGIRTVLENVNAYGVLSEFIGMTTDSRSILSFVRHDYFRRVLCSFIGEKVKSGEMPDDFELLKETAIKISYTNAKNAVNIK